MQTKIITYKRIVNLGNYESKHLEESIEISEGDSLDLETSLLMERVERKIREHSSRQIEAEIKEMKITLRNLEKEYDAVKTSLDDLINIKREDDEIPFDSGELSKDSTSSVQLTDGF